MLPAEFRAVVRSWIDDQDDALLPGRWQGGDVGILLTRQRRIQRKLFDAGLMRRVWPERVGGLGGSTVLRAVLGEELTGRGLVHTSTWSMHEVLGPAVIEYGKPSVVSEIFPRLLRGDEFWCQGFSEPDAGSDLGSLRTTARREGDTWVLNGEKLWTSFAHHASRCVVLARTGEPGSGSRGISAFLVDMNTPGIDVRPLRTMADIDEFCSIAFTDVVVPGEVTGSVPADAVLTGEAAGQAWRGVAAAGRRALGYQMLGAASAMIELATGHARTRVQFGQPVGSFQAVRHRLAEAFVAREGAAAALELSWEADDEELAAMLAKSLAGRAARITATHCQQVLAGLGFTSEHPFHRYLARALVLDRLLGSAAELPAEIGARLAAAGHIPRLAEL